VSSLAERVEIAPSALNEGELFDVVILIGHPDVGAAHAARAIQDYLTSIASAWTRLHQNGTLIIAFDPAAGSTAFASTWRAWLYPRTWATVSAIDGAVRSLDGAKVTRLHVFPSVWRPILVHTPESPAALKRMGFSHIGGWRGRAAARALLAGGQSPVDLFPAGIAWIASR
jgi:hypothetical protein